MSNEHETPRYSNVGFAAGAAGALCMLCIVVGQGAEQYAAILTSSSKTAVAVNIDPSVKAPKFGAIDFGATGSLKGQSPCNLERTTP